MLVCRLWTWHSSAKTRKKRGGGGGSARASPVAAPMQVSSFLRENMDCLEGECVAYVCVPFTDVVALYL